MLTRALGSFLVVGIAFTSFGCSKIKSMAGGGEGSLAILKDFEGEIGLTFKAAKEGKTANAVLEVKGDKVRVDVPEEFTASFARPDAPVGKVYGVYNGSDKKAFFALEAKKQAVVLDLNQLAEKAKAAAPPPAPATLQNLPKVTKTGRSEKVAGFDCEIWESEIHAPGTKTDGGVWSVCLGNEGASWFKLPTKGVPAEHAWMLEILDGKHFPLRITLLDKDKVEQFRTEVTKIEKKTVDAAKFEVPAGFQTMDLEQMMSQMMSGMGGMGMPPGAMGSARPGMPRLPPGFKPPVGQPPHR